MVSAPAKQSVAKPRRPTMRTWIVQGLCLGVEGQPIFLVQSEQVGPSPGGGLFFWNHGDKANERRAVLHLGLGDHRICREMRAEDFELNLPFMPGIKAES